MLQEVLAFLFALAALAAILYIFPGLTDPVLSTRRTAPASRLPQRALAVLPYKQLRRSQRVPLRIPISVRWAPPGSPATVKESTETEVVSAHGALIRLHPALARKSRIEITHQHTQQSASARVAWVGEPDKRGELFPVGVELSVPSQTFWGVSSVAPGSRSRPG